MTTGYVWNELYGWHDTGTFAGHVFPSTTVQPYQHFESAETKVRLASLLEVSGLTKDLVRIPAVPATEEDILRVHSAEHVARIKAESLNPKGGDAGDTESPFGYGGYDIALLAAGGAIEALRAVMNGTVNNSYALVRPPGHHARPSTGMGFCIFGNAAVAIENVRATMGVQRVVVVDWDVHHGNGTQEIYYSDPNVLCISVHQDNLYPTDSGFIDDIGDKSAPGSVINIPLPAGSGNGAYVETLDKVVLPAILRFKPDVIVVASGFDASASDPLGRMLVTASGYRQLTEMLLAVADEVCEGRVMMTHEGGYSPTYVPYCGLAVLEAMSGVKTDIDDPFGPGYERLPDQALTNTQASRIAQAAQIHGL
jgi:acetoin utilization deacetylase AcuC-like enzyme